MTTKNTTNQPLPLYKRLDEMRTQGEWTINHWTKREKGVSFIETKDGIKYFAGDGVSDDYYGLRSKLHPSLKHNLPGSFEGAHIAEMTDFKIDAISANECKANAKFTALAVNNLAALAEALEKINAAAIQGLEMDANGERFSFKTLAGYVSEKAKEALSRIS